jgi:hypothetical protein
MFGGLYLHSEKKYLITKTHLKFSIMKKILFSVILFALATLGSHAQGIKSRLMVIPSDNLLNDMKCYSTTVVQGVPVANRNYEKAFVDDKALSDACAAIAKKFIEKGFPLESLEETLKKIKNTIIKKSLLGVQTDPLTQVLEVARPDVILRLSYKLEKGRMTNKLSFTLEAVDSYTLKVVERTMEDFLTALAEHGKDIRENGRTIRLTVLVQDDPSIAFNLKTVHKSGDKYYEIIENLVNQMKIGEDTPNPVNETKVLLELTDIRIPYVDPVTKIGLSASRWSEKLLKELRSKYEIKGESESQGLGDAVIILTN